MNDIGSRPNAHRLGFMIPLVLFVLFFVACCGVLAGVFIQAAEVSSRAGQYNDAVQLCRNEAEYLRAAGAALPPVEGIWQRDYAADYSPADPENGEYTLMVTEARTPAAAGTMRTFTVAVYTDGEAPVYSLDVAVYLPEGR